LRGKKRILRMKNGGRNRKKYTLEKERVFKGEPIFWKRKDRNTNNGDAS